LIKNRTIVREKISSNNSISIRELYSGDMLEEINNGENTLILRNLNYFNGDYTHLEKIFKDHLLSDVYELNIILNIISWKQTY